MADWRAIVGANVRRIRQDVKLTQEQLAFAAQIDLTYVGGIERGKRNPSVLVLARIALALCTEPAALFMRSDGKHRPHSDTRHMPTA